MKTSTKYILMALGVAGAGFVVWKLKHRATAITAGTKPETPTRTTFGIPTRTMVGPPIATKPRDQAIKNAGVNLSVAGWRYR